MKRFRKLMNWFLLGTILVSNSPIMYAEEISQAIRQGQLEAEYQDALKDATEQTVGTENSNTTTASSSANSNSSPKDGGDAIQQPKVVAQESDAESALKAQYGEPVAKV